MAAAGLGFGANMLARLCWCRATRMAAPGMRTRVSLLALCSLARVRLRAIFWRDRVVMETFWNAEGDAHFVHAVRAMIVGAPFHP